MPAKSSDKGDAGWITHRYFRTYEIAGRLASIGRGGYDFRELEDLTIDDGVCAYIRKWPKDTAVHKVARWIADRMFYDDTGGPYFTGHKKGRGGQIEVVRYLSVDVRLRTYGFSTDAFEIPLPDDKHTPVRIKPNLTVFKESTVVEDACYDYFVNDLRLSSEYDELLTQISDEVFHIIFMNREAMADLHEFLARYVQELDADSLADEPELASLLAKDGGRLKRSGIPKWVRSAIFYRDRGRCVMCGRDLSGLIDTLPPSHFDHMTPLAYGGLNDVTNIQLLCQTCNNKKSASLIKPSNRYRRWY